MATPVLTNKVPVPVASIPLETQSSYLLDTLMGGTPGSFASDCDLTALAGTTNLTNGAVAGPFPSAGLCARRLYIEGSGTITWIGPTGVEDSQKVPADFYMYENVAYVLASSTCTGIHAKI